MSIHKEFEIVVKVKDGRLDVNVDKQLTRLEISGWLDEAKHYIQHEDKTIEDLGGKEDGKEK